MPSNGSSRRIRSSKPRSAAPQFEVSLGYLKPCLKNKGKRIQTKTKTNPTILDNQKGKADLSHRYSHCTYCVLVFSWTTGTHLNQHAMDLCLGNWHRGRYLLREEGLHQTHSLPTKPTEGSAAGDQSQSTLAVINYIKAKQVTHSFLFKDIKHSPHFCFQLPKS